MKWFLALISLTALTAAGERVVINEIHFDPAEKKPLEFLELHNPGAQAVDLGGWALEKFKFPPGSVIPPAGYVEIGRASCRERV